MDTAEPWQRCHGPMRGSQPPFAAADRARITAVLRRLILFAAGRAGPVLAIEACAIVGEAELIVVAKLESKGVPADRETYPLAGRLHIAGVVSGEWPQANPIRYPHVCSPCRKLTEGQSDRTLRFLTSEYGLWFLRRIWGYWMSADPQGAGYPGYRPLHDLDRYKNCLQGRRFSYEAESPRDPARP